MDGTTLSKNDNIRIGSSVYHVQTEYYKTSGEVVTLIFKKGEVVKKIENSLNPSEIPSQVVEKQHKTVIEKILSSVKAIEDKVLEKEKFSEVSIDEPVSGDAVDFFRTLISQIVKREDFVFANIADLFGKSVLEVVNREKGIDKDVIGIFIEGFLMEDSNFYYMNYDDLFLYGFKLENGNIAIIGFKKKESEKEIYQIVKNISSEYCKQPECKKCITVLVVEDVLFTRLVMRETFKLVSKELKSLCFKEIVEAESLGEALSFLKNGYYDIVITDINLGDGLGIDIAKFIKEKQLDTKVVALTMYPEEFRKFEELFDEFLAKPITPEQLKNKLIALFELKE